MGARSAFRIAQPPRQTRSAKILARPRFYLARVGFILRLAPASSRARALVIPKADKNPVVDGFVRDDAGGLGNDVAERAIDDHVRSALVRVPQVQRL